MSEQDRIFIKNFALVIAGLMAFTVVIILLAMSLNKMATRPANPERTAAVESRIAPVGDVYSGDTGRAALAQAETAAATDAPAAFDGSLDGEMIYQQVCLACHGAGVAGAPMLVADEWDSRVEQGMDVLVTHAIEGYQGPAGYMPPKGGRLDLSDEQVRVTVEWMVDQLE